MGPGACFDGLTLDGPVYLSGVTALGLALLFVWILRHEAFFGRRYFLATVGAMIFWLTAVMAELATPYLPCKMTMASATWPAITLAPIAWSLFMWHFCYRRPIRSNAPVTTGVAILVLTISAAALSNPAHGLFYGRETTLVLEGARPFAQFDHGPLFYAAAAVLYLFLMIGLGITVVASFQAPRPMRPMMMMLMFAAAVPMAANIGYVAMDVTLFGFDPTPFAFSFVLMVLTWVIYATRGFDLGTMARDLLYFNIVDPVLVVDAGGVVTSANPAATTLLPGVVPGKPLDPNGPLDLIGQVVGGKTAEATQAELALGERSFSMRVHPVPRPIGEAGKHLGAVAILSDVTQLKRNNAQLAEALDMAQTHLNEITRLREIAENLALDDPLTGIGNRRSLMARMKALAEQPLTMALMDLDHFKQINDSFGHTVGDRVLRSFTATIRGILPPDAELFRVGGEEFVLLIPDRPASDLLALLDRINAALIENPPLREHDHRRLTFSAGVAVRPGDGASFEDLYARADARLYQAKRGGRNRVMYADCVSFSGGGAVSEGDAIKLASKT